MLERFDIYKYITTFKGERHLDNLSSATDICVCVTIKVVFLISLMSKFAIYLGVTFWQNVAYYSHF